MSESSVIAMRDERVSDESSMRRMIEENLHGVGQLKALIHRLSPQAYRQLLGAERQQAIGKHVRHIIDHYDAFLQSLRGDDTCYLDYEAREREATLERDPKVGCDRLERLQEALIALGSEYDSHDAIDLRHATGGAELACRTSVGRELVFLSSHAVHHMAIIGLLAEQMGIVPPKDFGVHPSTLRHWERQEARLAATS